MMSRSALALLTTSIILPLALANAASQYHLDTHRQISECWSTCHWQVTHTVDLPGRTINDPKFITRNCEFDQYLDLMTLCIPQTCVSAPDAAYAVEYATRFCARAGVAVNLKLPDEYMQAAGEYFNSTAYLSKGTKGVGAWGMGGVVLVLGTAIALLV